MIPTLGLAGKFTAKSPFTIDANTSYVCRGVSYIQSLLDKGVDAYKNYYQTVGLDVDTFNADITNDVAIITLKDREGNSIDIPSSYLSEVPIDLEVPYQRYAALIEFGFLPEDTDVTSLIDKIKEESKTIIGLEAEAEIAVLPYEGFVTKSEDAELRKQREANLLYKPTTQIALKEALDREAQLKLRIQSLEEIIIKLT